MAFLAAIAPIVSLASGVVGAVGSIAAGNAQAAAANYNAKVQDQQARVARDQAAATSSQEVRKTRQLVSAAEAGALEDGLTLTGSTKAVVDQARDTGNLNAMLALYDGTLKAQGYQANATLDRMNAKASRTAGYIGAATSALGGASSYYQTKMLAV